MLGFQILIVESIEPDAKLPLDNVANEETEPECPFNVKTNDPMFGFHIMTEESSEPDAKLPFNNDTNEET